MQKVQKKVDLCLVTHLENLKDLCLKESRISDWNMNTYVMYRSVQLEMYVLK